MNKYIEVVDSETELVVRRLSVTQTSEKGADFIQDSLEEELPIGHFLRRVKCETELETGNL